MCGIAGIVYKDSGQEVSRSILEKMTEAIRHRGPDSDGFYIQRNIGLGMRRLAIIDLPGGGQPVSNEDQTVRVIFNGEIYNFKDLRAQLEKKGHRFRSHSDTETIVHAYEEYGAECVHHFRGMFAFAVWDNRNEKLFLARDRMGKKPLYYTQTPEGMVFGSELKSLFQVPGLQRRIHFPALDYYLTLQYVPDPLTAFEGIFKLPPAHHLTWQKGKITLQKYWELDCEPKHTGSEAELGNELLARLKESVRLRLVSDVPLGIHLSGGMDSSIITALAAQNTPRLRTFSMGFKEEKFSELPYARAVAEKYGTYHQEFVLSYGDVPAALKKLVRSFDEPFADPSALPVYYLSEATRHHVKVVLNGDGGDELFAGYPRYALDSFADFYARFPRFLTQKIIPGILSVIPQPVDRPGEKNPVAGMKRLAQAARISASANAVRWGAYFNEEMKSRLWKRDCRPVMDLTTEDFIGEKFDACDAVSRLDRTLYADMMTYLPGDLLVKADRMTMLHSLEARSPFLDHEFVIWAARLPVSMKLRGGVSKYLLKKACRSLLPDAVNWRGKQGFGIPTGAWLRGPLREWSREILLDPQAGIFRFLEKNYVEFILNDHLKGSNNHGSRIWALLMLELWLKEYL